LAEAELARPCPTATNEATLTCRAIQPALTIGHDLQGQSGRWVSVRPYPIARLTRIDGVTKGKVDQDVNLLPEKHDSAAKRRSSHAKAGKSISKTGLSCFI